MRDSHRSWRGSSRLAAWGAVVALVLAPAAASAESMGREAGLGVGSMLASLVYGPTKLVYATGGLLVGGLAYAFSGGDKDVAQVVLNPSVRGDYVVTPEQLTGKRGVQFFGRIPDAEQEDLDVAAAPPAW